MGTKKGQKKTACRDCVSLTWEYLFTEVGSFPAGQNARCKKSENEKIKETGFNPVTGEDWEKEYYPGGDGIFYVGERYKLCKEINTGNCPKFEEATEGRA